MPTTRASTARPRPAASDRIGEASGVVPGNTTVMRWPPLTTCAFVTM